MNNRLNHDESHVWLPFTQIDSSSSNQIALRGSGAYLYNEKNEPIIDGISSWWVTLHGHGNEYIANAISIQAKKLEQVILADFTHEAAEKIARRLSFRTNLQRAFFSDNGSTAVEVALKIACQWWQNINEPRHQIIAFNGAYHGDTFGAMALGERNLFNAPFEKMLFPVARVPWPETWLGDDEVDLKEKEALDKLESLLIVPTAAVIIEPLVQGAGGMKMVREEFLKKVDYLVKQSGALLIADEVMTGFGRCGRLFAHQCSDIQPDLISLSKGLTGGFLPMGITMASEKIFSAFISNQPELTFWHGHSFTGNPLGCAAANASLDLLEATPSLYENFEARHSAHLTIINQHPKVRRARLKGTIAAFEIKVDGPRGYLNHAGKQIKKDALEEGVFIRPLGDVVYLLPPLCISDDQLEKCYFVIQNCLDKL